MRFDSFLDGCEKESSSDLGTRLPGEMGKIKILAGLG